MNHPSIYLSVIFILSLFQYFQYNEGSSSTGNIAIISNSNQENQVKVCQGFSNKTLSPDQVKSVKDFLQYFHNSNDMLNLLNSQDSTDWSNYVLQLLILTIPFLALALISLVLWILFGVKMTCCKNKRYQKPKRISISIYASIAILFLIATVTMSFVLMFYNSPSIQQQFTDSQCSLYKAYETFYQGNVSLSWLGLNNIQPEWNLLSSNLSSNFNSAKQIVNNLDQNKIDNMLNQLQTSMVNLQNTYEGKTVLSPNPSQTAQQQIVIDFIQNFAPNTTQFKYMNIMWQEYFYSQEIQQELITNLQSNINNIPLIEVINEVTSEVNSTFTILNSGIPSDQDVDDTQNDINSVMKTSMSYFNYTMLANACILIFTILSIFVMVIKKNQFGRRILLIGWCLTSLVTIVGFLLASAFVLTNFASQDVCQTTDTILSSQQNFQKYTNKLINNNDSYQYITPCFFNIPNQILNDLNQYLKPVNEIFDNFNDIEKEINGFNNQSNQYVSEQLINIIQEIESNPINASTQLNGDANTQIAVSDLNSFSDYQTTNSKQSYYCHPVISADNIVFNQDDCIQSQIVLQDGEENYNFGPDKQSCIIISSNFQIEKRVGTNYNNCAQVDNSNVSNSVGQNIIDYYNRLNQFSIDLNNSLLIPLQQDLNSKLQLDQQYNQYMFNYNQDLMNSLQQTRNSVYSISDPQSGFISQLNCRAFGYGVEDFQTSICQGFSYELFWFTIILISLCLCLLIGNIFVFIIIQKLSYLNHRKYSSVDDDEEDSLYKSINSNEDTSLNRNLVK